MLAWLSMSWCDNDCVVSVKRFGSHRCGAMFIYVWTIQMNQIYSIRDNKLNQWLLICCKTRVIGILITIVISNVYA